ncbi:TIGR03751 family conjugal transfer lipoprotein [Janthinobacterium sp. BJB446]|uniref:TIGR03751 family conjugal transfer lipoprotein n=1 Tax=Janthinobacterium sp. BJB446 TaxID=2048009 RepID=UPI000C0F0BBE|nr:TIGR03751 family conjugal transfer lipoprotein [Janthinobacterium sp. BJB446]PHV19193.1 TIGR03751 family conjugal transfer lipoprotein [Janthinobacterium sp. BJB446]
MKLTSIMALPVIAGIVSLQGCSVSGPRESPLPRNGPKMIDIYERHVEENSGRASSAQSELPRRPYDEPARENGSDVGLVGAMYSRFARLPNPDIEMYVYPHLAKGKYPVPGYVTVFPMFESVQYALPGEVAPSALAASRRMGGTDPAAQTPDSH